MAEIVIKRHEPKKKRAVVVVSSDTHADICVLSKRIGATIESTVDLLLREALKLVKIED